MSGFIGVNWSERAQKWEVKIRMEGKQKYLGLFDFDSEEAAARKYDVFASNLGRTVNFPEVDLGKKKASSVSTSSVREDELQM